MNQIRKVNLIVFLGIIILIILVVTCIGYFDEGNVRIYQKFYTYISSQAYPPFSDYAVWSVIG